MSLSNNQELPTIVHEKVDIEPCQPLDAELADFIETVRRNGKPLVDGATGIEALRVAMEVKKKMEGRASDACHTAATLLGGKARHSITETGANNYGGLSLKIQVCRLRKSP
jgi:hypothetical protein